MDIDPPIAMTDTVADSDAEELRGRLHEFNSQQTGYRDGRSLACFLRDSGGKLIAGIDGFTWGGYARIEYVWVEAPDFTRSSAGSSCIRSALTFR